MKTLILLDQTVSIPLKLADKEAEGGNAILNPTGEVSDLLADKLVATYPLKYAYYDEAKAEHKELVTKGTYPEATKIISNELDINFAELSREDKLDVIAYIKKMKTKAKSKK